MDRELVKAIMTENGQGNLSAELECLDGLREVKSSTCLLLPTTPSPHPMDFKHPLSEEMSESPLLPLNDDPTTLNLQNMDGSGGDSSSSADSNSVVQDPVSAQLINNISMLDYQILSKNGDLILGEAEECKLNGSLNVSNRKLPNFVNWNWVIIRKVLFWFVLSGLVACLATIVALVVTLPRQCNPELPWYQGKVFYEVFPPSFKDSNGDGIGDLKGLVNNLDYIQGLGASVLRLNSIFPAHGYPEHYKNVTSLLTIDPSLGEMRDFQDLVTEIHSRKMSIILDIPVRSMALPISNVNGSHTIMLTNDTLVSYLDPTTKAIAFWARAQNVDGIYLKDLELYVSDLHYERTLPLWKQIIGNGKILMASEDAYGRGSLEVFLSSVDLIDVHLETDYGTMGLKDCINQIMQDRLWSKPQYPWVHWNIGNVGSERISTNHAEDTLAIISLQFMLPGTVSIFYGDEKGLGSLAKESIEGDFHEHKLIKNLVIMPFFKTDKAGGPMLPWNSASALKPNEAYVDTIKHLAELRRNTPTIYLRGIYKEGSLLKNTNVDRSLDDLVVIERWYPRRNTCVFVANLGPKPVTMDLSSKFYGGYVIGGTNSSLVGEYLHLDNVTFPPHSAVILKLDK